MCQLCQAPSCSGQVTFLHEYPCFCTWGPLPRIRGTFPGHLFYLPLTTQLLCPGRSPHGKVPEGNHKSRHFTSEELPTSLLAHTQEVQGHPSVAPKACVCERCKHIGVYVYALCFWVFVYVLGGHACGGQRSTSGVILYHSLPQLLRRGLSLNLHRLISSARDLPVLTTPPVLGLQFCSTQYFNIRVGGQTQGSHSAN